MNYTKSAIIVFLILLVDQVVKIWIKTHMYLGEEFSVLGDWFKIHFTENEGMAFGMTFGGSTGKLFLTIFRLIAVGFIAYYIHKLIKHKEHPGFIACFSLILAGAIGNIIDSVFYGVIFSDSNYQIAQLFPKEGGYEQLLFGRVVDMLYFPIYEGYLPSWIPLWGGDYFIFFRPVFNIADASITTGVACIIIFQKVFFKNPNQNKIQADGK